ncbi:MAG: hypothetical protein AB7E51_14970 [Pseudodesulfovibrio sp.]|uniref:hypothetical protein n=1 Tax=Pseudodesulfovibrio sp. TaxID=2035812 RepID=UPI003D0A7F6B
MPTTDDYREILALILENARYYPGDEENRSVIDVHVLNRVRDVMSDFNPLVPSTQSKIIRELSRVIAELGGDSSIQSITGSYRDTLPDAEILGLLSEYSPSLRKLGREAFENAIRKEALKHVLKFGLDPQDIEEAAGNILHELDAYNEEGRDAA